MFEASPVMIAATAPGGASLSADQGATGASARVSSPCAARTRTDGSGAVAAIVKMSAERWHRDRFDDPPSRPERSRVSKNAGLVSPQGATPLKDQDDFAVRRSVKHHPGIPKATSRSCVRARVRVRKETCSTRLGCDGSDRVSSQQDASHDAEQYGDECQPAVLPVVWR